MGSWWGKRMQPKGFWSYARGDDDHLDQMLSELRRQIAGEVSMLMGKDIGIFQDIHDLRTGDRWEDGLREGLSKASFLVPVLTPLFFNRDWCRKEVLTYLRLSKEAGLEPRIFPVRFVPWDDEDGCEVRAALQPFQYKDFSNWRFESDPTRRSVLLNEFAKDVKARLKLPVVARPVAKAVEVLAEAIAMPSPGAMAKAPPAPRYRTYTVDPFPGRGDFTSIGAAIEAAEAGARIVVREGTYRESLRLSKPLEIFGEGNRERIVVVTAVGNALLCDAPMARVQGMRFRREAGGADFALWIPSGAADFEDCVFESLSLSCVSISEAGTSPTFRRCVMRLGAQGGVLAHKGAQPLLEDCEVSGNVRAGVGVSGATTMATLRRCTARDGRNSGYFFMDGAGGLMDQCESIGNEGNGVGIVSGANPELRECVIRGNRGAGFASQGGLGRIQGGRIEGNGHAGVASISGGRPEVAGCTIAGNGYQAIWIADAESGGTFRDNDLRGNARGAWDIAEGAVVEREGNVE